MRRAPLRCAGPAGRTGSVSSSPLSAAPISAFMADVCAIHAPGSATNGLDGLRRRPAFMADVRAIHAPGSATNGLDGLRRRPAFMADVCAIDAPGSATNGLDGLRRLRGFSRTWVARGGYARPPVSDGPLRIGIVGLGRMGRFHAAALAGVHEVGAGRAGRALSPTRWSWPRSSLPRPHGLPERRRGAGPSRAGGGAGRGADTQAPRDRRRRPRRGAARAVREAPGPRRGRGTAASARLAADAACVLQVGFWRRFAPPWRQAKARIDAGEIGTPIYLRLAQWDADPPPAEFCDPAVSGGLAIDCGVHEYDLAEWLTGRRRHAGVGVGPPDRRAGRGRRGRRRQPASPSWSWRAAPWPPSTSVPQRPLRRRRPHRGTRLQRRAAGRSAADQPHPPGRLRRRARAARVVAWTTRWRPAWPTRHGAFARGRAGRSGRRAPGARPASGPRESASRHRGGRVRRQVERRPRNLTPRRTLGTVDAGAAGGTGAVPVAPPRPAARTPRWAAPTPGPRPPGWSPTPRPAGSRRSRPRPPPESPDATAASELEPGPLVLALAIDVGGADRDPAADRRPARTWPGRPRPGPSTSAVRLAVE